MKLTPQRSTYVVTTMLTAEKQEHTAWLWTMRAAYWTFISVLEHSCLRCIHAAPPLVEMSCCASLFCKSKGVGSASAALKALRAGFISTSHDRQ
jgi:hypothetical protein